MPTKDAETSRDRQREETHRRVYEAALEVIRRDGLHPARVDDIVRAAGVSRGTFYFHFPTKDLVLVERLRESELRIAGMVDELAADTPLERVLGAVCGAVADEWKGDPRLFIDVGMVAVRMIAEMTSAEANPVRASLVPRFREAGRRRVIVDDLPAEVLADIFLVNLFAAMLSWCAAPTLPLGAMLDKVVSLLLHGIGRRP